MRTIGAKDKVIKRDYNKMKSYNIYLSNGENIMTQAKNRFELKKNYPTIVKYFQLQGYDD